MPKQAIRADRGWFEPGVPVRDGYFRLGCAVLKQAARDAVGIDGVGELRRVDALLWLLDDAPIWLEGLGLGELEPERFLAARGPSRARRIRSLEAGKV